MVRVLIVDDNRFTRELLEEILLSDGIEVVGEATNGREAVRFNAQLQPDLTIMDVVMPVMNGVEATKKILEANPNGKIIISSVLGQDSMVIDALAAGAKEYLEKPFNGKAVLRIVRRILADLG